MDNVLIASEIDMYIETMKPQKLIEIGNNSWLEWHQRLQKLNQQAIVEATALKEEYVKETLVTYGKVPVLVHEAILINIWKYKVLPILLRIQPNPESTFIVYSVLYHEAVAVALLEVVMYHENCSEALEDSAVDLLDYVYGTISQLLILEKRETKISEKTNEEIMRQRDDLSFEIGIRSLSIIRYMADYLEKLPLSITAKMFSTHDVPVLLVQILLTKPWLRDDKQYNSGRWLNYDGESLIQSEAQVWLALRQLLLDPACPTHYTITNSRRPQLMKLQALLTPVLLDQLSPLIELKQWLCRLAVAEQPSSAPKPVLLETLAEIKEKILTEVNGKWKNIAKKQINSIFNNNKESLREIAQNLSEAYNMDLLEKFEKRDEINCTQCGKVAIQRCSRCKKQWYCSRSCQINHWSQHKDVCSETEVS